MDSKFDILSRMADQIQWPTVTHTAWNQATQQQFQANMNLLNTWHHDPDVLVKALQGFAEIPNPCYGKAGVAAALLMAGQADKALDPDKLEQVCIWLDAAKLISDTLPAVRAVEAQYLSVAKEFEQAMGVLQETACIHGSGSWLTEYWQQLFPWWQPQ